MKSICLYTASLLLISSPPSFAQASEQSETSPELFSKVDRYLVSYKINEDGSFVEDREFAVTVLKEQAIKSVKEHSITYSTSIQKAEVIDAYTLKKDGRRIDSPKTNFQVETNTGKGKDAPVFSDWTTMTVVFPDVEVGDTVVFSYRLVATEPMFPKQFSTIEYFPRTDEYDDVQVKIDAPSSLWTQYRMWGMNEIANSDSAGRKIIEWSYANPKPIKNKRRDYSVYDVESEPGFEYSTFHNYNEVAEAYGLRARPKAVATDRIKKLAEELTKESKTSHDVARSLYDWVAVNITYAGSCIGLGAVVPHDTDFILDNRMGDCKDHATLLQALLAAKGIESAQVLVNADSSYKLPSVPVVSMVNHVINYIPSLSLYADSTSSTTPFGMLPFSDQDKPVLHVNGYKDGLKTPATVPGTNVQTMRTRVNIQPDGSFKADVEINLKGAFAVGARAQMRYLKKETQDDLIKNMYKAMGYQGSGVFVKDDATALLDTYRYGAKFDVKNFYEMPGTGAFRIAPLIYNQAPIAGIVSEAIQHEEEPVDGTCSNGKTVEEYHYLLPKGIRVLSIPGNLKVINKYATYEARYIRKGNEISAIRTLDDRTIGNVCSHQYAEEFRDFARKVLPNLNAQVVYK